MTTLAIRKKLHSFIADADEKRLKGMYLLLEDEISKGKTFDLTKEHLRILDTEREKHLKGESKSYTWEEAKKIIRNKRKA